MNDDQFELFCAFHDQESNIINADPDEDDEKFVSMFSEKLSSKFDEFNINKRNYSYHLPLDPDPVGDAISNADKYVDRTMLRAIFALFFNFDEENFRRDLFKRANMMHTEIEPASFDDGYSKLTEDLENPLGNYINTGNNYKLLLDKLDKVDKGISELNKRINKLLDNE